MSQPFELNWRAIRRDIKDGKRQLSRAGLWSYLAYGAVQRPWTMVEGVTDDPLVWKPSFELRPWKDRAEAQSAVTAALEASIRRICEANGGRMPAAFLSGGIDSGAVVALMRRISDGEIRTYCVTHEDSRTDERVWARMVAERNGTKHVELPLTGQMISNCLDEVIGAYDQPSMDGLNAYFAAKLISAAGEGQVMSGCGGDELFAGYGCFSKARKAYAAAKVLKFFPRALGGVVTRMARTEPVRKLGMMMGYSGDPYFLTRRIFDDRQIAALLGEDVKPPRMEGLMPSDLPEEIVNRTSWLEMSTNMTSMYLRDAWQTALPFGLKVLLPLLDCDLVDLMFSIPGSWKCDAEIPKPLLVRAAGDGLPMACVKRPKQGFSLPFDRYLSGALKERVDTFLFGGDSQLFDAHELRRIGTAYKRGHLHWGRVWALFMVENWCRVNGVTR